MVEGTLDEQGRFVVRATPEHAPAIDLHILQVVSRRRRDGSFSYRYYVSRHDDPWAAERGKYITRHNDESVAIRSALHRAKRYVKAYSVPRTLTPAAA